MMHADNLNMRLYLNVPHSEKEEAKRLGAWWDEILKKWWIDRRTLAINPGVYRWLERGSLAYRQAKEAFDFLNCKSRGPRPNGGRTSSRKAKRGRMNRSVTYAARVSRLT